MEGIISSDKELKVWVPTYVHTQFWVSLSYLREEGGTIDHGPKKNQ